MRCCSTASFELVGGFDEQRFPQPSIEEIELGYTLRRASCRTLLDKELQGTHLEGWTLASLVRTDVLTRAIPWSRLILESGNAPASPPAILAVVLLNRDLYGVLRERAGGSSP